jgi:hypothetical protein
MFDVIVVVKLDSIFHSVQEFVRVVSTLSRHGVRFVCTD